MSQDKVCRIIVQYCNDDGSTTLENKGAFNYYKSALGEGSGVSREADFCLPKWGGGGVQGENADILI